MHESEPILTPLHISFLLEQAERRGYSRGWADATEAAQSLLGSDNPAVTKLQRQRYLVYVWMHRWDTYGIPEAPPSFIDGELEPRQVIRLGHSPYNEGEVDDIVIDGDLFRMERMTETSWWLAIYRGEQRVSFDLLWDEDAHKIMAYVQDDELGCTDDTPQHRLVVQLAGDVTEEFVADHGEWVRVESQRPLEEE